MVGPPPSRSGDLEQEGGVNVSLRKYGVVHGILTGFSLGKNYEWRKLIHVTPPTLIVSQNMF